MTESDDSRVNRAMPKPLSERLERWLDPMVCNVNDELRADIREAAALARRVEGAGVFQTSEWHGDELGRCDFHPHHVAVELHRSGVKPYTHIALVPVEAPPSTEGDEG